MSHIDELEKRFKKTRLTIPSLRNLLLDVKNWYDIVQESISDQDRFIRSEHLINSSFQDAISLSTDGFNQIRRNYADIYDREKGEFGYYEDDLISGLYDESLISVYRNGRSAVVELNLEEVFGTIDDYVQAVKAARIAVKKGKTVIGDSIRRSRFWRFMYQAGREGQEIFDKRAKEAKVYRNRSYYFSKIYGETMYARAEGFTSLAPWWSLFEYGNTNIEIGITADGLEKGIPYPSNGPSYFFRNYKNELQALLQSEFNITYEEDLQKHREELDRRRRSLRRVQRLIDNILSLIEDLEDHEEERRRLKEWVEDQRRRYGAESIRDTNKLISVINLVILGQETQDRYRLGNGQRIRIKQLKRNYYREFGLNR